MKKNLLSLLMICPILITGCGGEEDEEGGEGGGTNTSESTIPPASVEPLDPASLKIRFHVDAKSVEGQAYKKIIAAFNRDYSKYDVKVSAAYVARTGGDSAYEKQLATDVKEGTLPDIITFESRR